MRPVVGERFAVCGFVTVVALAASIAMLENFGDFKREVNRGVLCFEQALELCVVDFFDSDKHFFLLLVVGGNGHPVNYYNCIIHRGY